MFHGHLDYFQKPPLGGRPNTKPGDHGTPNAHNRWFILFYHVWGPAWIEIHWNSIWLRARSHTTSHFEGPWSHYLILEGVLGRPLDTFFWALTISWWSRLLAHVWSGPKMGLCAQSIGTTLDTKVNTIGRVCHLCECSQRNEIFLLYPSKFYIFIMILK